MFSPHFWCAMAFVIKIMPFQNLVYMVLTWGTCALHLFNVRHPHPQPWKFICLSLSITSMNPFWQLFFLTPFSFNIPSKHYERHIRPAFLICEALDNLGMECAGTRTRWSSMTNAVTCCGQRFLHQMKVVLQPDLRYWTVYIWLDGGSLDVTQINSKKIRHWFPHFTCRKRSQYLMVSILGNAQVKLDVAFIFFTRENDWRGGLSCLLFNFGSAVVMCEWSFWLFLSQTGLWY